MKAMEILYAECRKRGVSERYHQELEYRFAELYYVVTLFSYMQGVRQPRISFVRELREGVEVKFPDFRENVYYRQYTGQEEQRLIALQGQSDRKFYRQYRLKLWVRRLRKRLGK